MFFNINITSVFNECLKLIKVRQNSIICMLILLILIDLRYKWKIRYWSYNIIVSGYPPRKTFITPLKVICALNRARAYNIRVYETSDKWFFAQDFVPCRVLYSRWAVLVPQSTFMEVSHFSWLGLESSNSRPSGHSFSVSSPSAVQW